MKKRIIVVYTIIFLLMSAVLCLTIIRFGQDSSLPQYTTDINRLLIKLGEQWKEDISQNDSVLVKSEAEFNCAVIDNNGGPKIYTREDMSFTISNPSKAYSRPLKS